MRTDSVVKKELMREEEENPRDSILGKSLEVRKNSH